ncbi:hypothetical protein FKM82_000876 [Ascaphus truei]
MVVHYYKYICCYLHLQYLLYRLCHTCSSSSSASEQLQTVTHLLLCSSWQSLSQVSDITAIPWITAAPPTRHLSNPLPSC